MDEEERKTHPTLSCDGLQHELIVLDIFRVGFIGSRDLIRFRDQRSEKARSKG